MKTKKGFTLVEIMIVVVIIGLLAAMAIPAFQKIKYSSLHQSITKGEIVSPEQYKDYREYVKKNPNAFGKSIENKPTVEAEAVDTIIINGKKYRLVAE